MDNNYYILDHSFSSNIPWEYNKGKKWRIDVEFLGPESLILLNYLDFYSNTTNLFNATFELISLCDWMLNWSIEPEMLNR